MAVDPIVIVPDPIRRARELFDHHQEDWDALDSVCPSCRVATMHLASPELERRGLCGDCLERLVDLVPTLIAEIDARPARVTGETSDGYHTFNELYAHRGALFLAVARLLQDKAEEVYGGTEHELPVWRSKLHHDGTMFPGWFILGIGKAPGEQITYHLPIGDWDRACFAVTLDHAPAFDGHTSDDVLARLARRFWL